MSAEQVGDTGYLDRQVAAVASGLLPVGKVSDCTIGHDDWCPKVNGWGSCSCVPRIVCQYRDDDGLTVTVEVP